MTIDVDKFTSHLRMNAKAQSQAQCAKYVRHAFEAGGAKTEGHPSMAKAWGATLQRNGFLTLAISRSGAYRPLKGDIVVIQPTAKGSKAGHIQAFDGKDWISDFVQRDFWPGPGYRRERPSLLVYRRP